MFRICYITRNKSENFVVKNVQWNVSVVALPVSAITGLLAYRLDIVLLSLNAPRIRILVKLLPAFFPCYDL